VCGLYSVGLLLDVYMTTPLLVVMWGVTLAGDVFTWGCNLRGQCGHEVSEVACPRLLKALCGVPIKTVAAGLNHTLAMSAAGDVYAWGANECGQLGLGHTEHALSPVLLEASVVDDVAQIAAGSRCASLSLQLHAHPGPGAQLVMLRPTRHSWQERCRVVLVHLSAGLSLHFSPVYRYGIAGTVLRYCGVDMLLSGAGRSLDNVETLAATGVALKFEDRASRRKPSAIMIRAWGCTACLSGTGQQHISCTRGSLPLVR
jgi:Regulator of chromosome condensation (RCC1) repeat